MLQVKSIRAIYLYVCFNKIYKLKQNKVISITIKKQYIVMER